MAAMSDTSWLLLSAAMAWLCGRIVKIYPRFPKALLPWIVLAAGYGLAFGLALHAGAAPRDAALGAWRGLGAGLLAIGGHEARKGPLVRFLGPGPAARILGKLPAPQPKEDDKP